MHADAIPYKTELARNTLQQRDALPRGHRLFLIMVDGQKSLRQLAEAAKHLDIDDLVLRSLVESGLIQWQAMSRRTFNMPSAVDAPSPPSTPRVAPARSPRSLAAAKIYAMDLAALMLPGQDGGIRDAARNVTDAGEMHAWLTEAAQQIAARAGDERAALFVAKVASVLPVDFLLAAKTPQ
jgi:hypothetical protein